MPMTDMELQLLEVLRNRSFKRGTFRLASGDTSSYYIDGKLSEVYSRAAYLIGEVLYARTKDLAIDAIGGLEVGAVPLATAAVISYHHHGREMEGFWVRDGAKAHGTKKLVEGGVKKGAKVAILDDVITRGTSSLKAVDAVREQGCEVVLVLSLVDRLVGARSLFEEHGITHYQSVFTIRDFGVEADVPDAVQAASR
jgi:orotate phosphoribosyltransferase